RAEHRRPQADRHVDRPALVDDRPLGDPAADALADLEGGGLVAAGQDDQELLATVAADEVVGARRRRHAGGRLHQGGVAGRVAVGVVDELEVVEVGQHDAYGAALAAAAAQLALEDLEDGAVVPGAGERVAGGLPPHRLAGGDQLVLEGDDPPPGV